MWHPRRERDLPLRKWRADSPTAISTVTATWTCWSRRTEEARYLYRNDLRTANRSLRLRLVGTKSNRDAVGAVARVFTPDGAQSRMVKTGSSYLSQSELALTFGLGRREAVRVVIEWPSGAVQEFKKFRRDPIRSWKAACPRRCSLVPAHVPHQRIGDGRRAGSISGQPVETFVQFVLGDLSQDTGGDPPLTVEECGCRKRLA